MVVRTLWCGLGWLFLLCAAPWLVLSDWCFTCGGHEPDEEAWRSHD